MQIVQGQSVTATLIMGQGASYGMWGFTIPTASTYQQIAVTAEGSAQGKVHVMYLLLPLHKAIQTQVNTYLPKGFASCHVEVLHSRAIAYPESKHHQE